MERFGILRNLLRESESTERGYKVPILKIEKLEVGIKKNKYRKSDGRNRLECNLDMRFFVPFFYAQKSGNQPPWNHSLWTHMELWELLSKYCLKRVLWWSINYKHEVKVISIELKIINFLGTFGIGLGGKMIPI